MTYHDRAQTIIPIASHRLILALGANREGGWGRPEETLARAVSKLRTCGLSSLSVSSLFETRAVGPGRQAPYRNAVLVAHATLPLGRLLHHLKALERQAGRRVAARWGPRPLDIDIIDYGGRVLGWPIRSGKRPQLVLPHPEAHRRAFVLMPLIEVAPKWVHPALGVPGKRLLRGLQIEPGSIRRILDSRWVSCHVRTSGGS
jgi:2-amino-4-hydroxy-6-hydroxymethyldihydropteridine diphosphokinase